MQIGDEPQQVFVGGASGEGQVSDVVVGVPVRHLSEMGRAQTE